MSAKPHLHVGSRELKSRLGTYLRTVQSGQILVVTDRGRPVAELRPLSVPAPDENDAAMWRRLVDSGVVSGIPAKDPLPEEAFAPIQIKGKPLSQTIIEDRDDRF